MICCMTFIFCDIESCWRCNFHRWDSSAWYDTESWSATRACPQVTDISLFTCRLVSVENWISICIAFSSVRNWSSWGEGSSSQPSKDWAKRNSDLRYLSALRTESLDTVELGFLYHQWCQPFQLKWIKSFIYLAVRREECSHPSCLLILWSSPMMHKDPGEVEVKGRATTYQNWWYCLHDVYSEPEWQVDGRFELQFLESGRGIEPY